MLSNCEIETARLRAHPWHRSGLYDPSHGSLAQVVATILTSRTTGALPPSWAGDYDEARAEAWISEREGDGATLLVVSKEDARPVGLLLLFATEGSDGLAEVRIGYVFAESAWGARLGH